MIEKMQVWSKIILWVLDFVIFGVASFLVWNGKIDQLYWFVISAFILGGISLIKVLKSGILKPSIEIGKGDGQ